VSLVRTSAQVMPVRTASVGAVYRYESAQPPGWRVYAVRGFACLRDRACMVLRHACPGITTARHPALLGGHGQGWGDRAKWMSLREVYPRCPLASRRCSKVTSTILDRTLRRRPRDHFEGVRSQHAAGARCCNPRVREIAPAASQPLTRFFLNFHHLKIPCVA
jgi:hypothetical protein